MATVEFLIDLIDLISKQTPMSEKTKDKKVYDLSERTALFAKNIVNFSKKIPRNSIVDSIKTQLIRSGTSIGANYYEADDAEPSKDFRHKIGIAKKESWETMYWLRLISETEKILSKEATNLWQEAKELNLIFNAIINKLKAPKI